MVNNTPRSSDRRFLTDAINYDFSIIMAVYNVELFIREAIDSVISQSFGFDRVQLILVNDGTKDSSGEICEEYREKYPKNIVVIHKENGGQATARNEGLRRAEGRYINFMDPDDKLSENTLEDVYRFFIEFDSLVDMVSIPLHFFDGQQGEHWQNTKFSDGNRIIYLESEYKVQQTSASSCFYRHEVRDLLWFDSTLPVSEDFKINLRVMAEKRMMGVVSTCKYWYRRRSQGEASTVQRANIDRRFYFDWFEHFAQWACDFYLNRFGYIPAFVQYAVLCDVLWRYRDDNMEALQEALSEEELNQYLENLHNLLKRFDDKYILDLPKILPKHKYMMLRHKYGCMPELTRVVRDAVVRFENTQLISLGSLSTQIDFLRIRDGKLCIEGLTYLMGVTEDEPVQVFLWANNKHVPCDPVDRSKENQYRFGEIMSRAVGFKCEMPLNPGVKEYDIRVACVVRDMFIVKKTLSCGQFTPLADGLKNNHFFKDSWMVNLSNNWLVLKPYHRKEALRREFDLMKELWRANKPGMRKAVLARAMYLIGKRFKREQIWMISDRVQRAGDNGEALFRYLCEKKPAGIKPYFVISKDSPDYAALSKIGPVVEYASQKHKVLHLLADRVISSAGEEQVTNPFGAPGEYYKDILSQIPYVFLQHGVIRNNLSGWLNRYNKAIDGFVTSAHGEYKSILEDDYYYDEDSVWLTGLARFDRLYRDSKRCITFMPTWRKHLMTRYDPATGTWGVGERFLESDYFKFYSSLLSHPRLLEAAKKYEYTLQFYPHPNIMQHIDLFKADPSIRMLREDTEYRTVYAESDLVITDYSSAVVDFSYLNLPTVYAQFDAESFFSGDNLPTKGYFDYERDGFGEVTYDLESTVDCIIDYMKNGCRMKPEYSRRVEEFFAHRDQNNCQRIFEKICSMKGR